MHRCADADRIVLVAVALTAPVAGAVGSVHRGSHAGDGPSRSSPKARLTGWVARRDGYHLYREGSTVKLIVAVRPDLADERRARPTGVAAPGCRLAVARRLVDQPGSTHSHQSFLRPRGLPAGYSFRIRVKVPPGERARFGSFALAVFPRGLKPSTPVFRGRLSLGWRARSRRPPGGRARTADRSGG